MANNGVNYEDERFKQVEKEESAALKESDKMYNGMINSSDSFYNKQIEAAENWGDKQAQLQQDETDFTIEKIEQQKDQANKDYLKEQSGAYVDWQKQSNQYGVNAEQQAQNGLAFTGYSESSKVAMYNTYQNRVATAKESYNKAVLEYDNMMKDARLQNNAALAEIAYQTLQTTLELSLQGFQYKNQLILDKANAKTNIQDRYYNRYQGVLSQINTENALEEEKRQFNETMAFNKSKSNGSSGSSSSSDGNVIKKSTGDDTESANYFLTIEDAANYMRKNGIKSASDVHLYDARTWVNKKKSGEKGDEFLFDTYADYLTAYVAYCEEKTKS